MYCTLRFAKTTWIFIASKYQYFEDKVFTNYRLPWEPKTFIFRGYNPYIGGLKPSFFMVLGSKGNVYLFVPNMNRMFVPYGTCSNHVC